MKWLVTACEGKSCSKWPHFKEAKDTVILWKGIRACALFWLFWQAFILLSFVQSSVYSCVKCEKKALENPGFSHVPAPRRFQEATEAVKHSQSKSQVRKVRWKCHSLLQQAHLNCGLPKHTQELQYYDFKCQPVPAALIQTELGYLTYMWSELSAAVYSPFSPSGSRNGLMVLPCGQVEVEVQNMVEQRARRAAALCSAADSALQLTLLRRERRGWSVVMFTEMRLVMLTHYTSCALDCFQTMHKE